MSRPSACGSAPQWQPRRTAYVGITRPMEAPAPPRLVWEVGAEGLIQVLLHFPSAPYGFPKKVPTSLLPSLSVRDLRLLVADTIGISFHEQILYGSDHFMLRNDQTLAECGETLPVSITVLQDASLIARPPRMLTDAGPVLHAIRPTQGTTQGGTRVELISERLGTGAHVPVCRFGGQVLPVTLKGEAVYVMSPPHAPGPASVEVSPDGVHWSHSGIRFLYIDPYRPEGEHGLAVRVPARSCYSNEVRRVGLQASSPLTYWRPDDPGGCV